MHTTWSFDSPLFNALHRVKNSSHLGCCSRVQFFQYSVTIFAVGVSSKVSLNCIFSFCADFNPLFSYPDCRGLSTKRVTSLLSARLWSYVSTVRWYLVSGTTCLSGVSSRPSCCTKHSKLCCLQWVLLLFFVWRVFWWERKDLTPRNQNKKFLLRRCVSIWKYTSLLWTESLCPYLSLANREKYDQIVSAFSRARLV